MAPGPTGRAGRRSSRRSRRSGVKTVAAPLPLTSFQDDVAALDRTLERVDGPVVLAGHAYAGAVIGATRSDKVKALVYVAALAPDEGETVADVFYSRHAASAGAQARAGRAWADLSARSGLRRRLRAKRLQEELAVLAAVQRPISPACITVKVGRPLWKDRPAWFLVAEQDRMIIAGQSPLHGRADEGSSAVASCRSRAARDRAFYRHRHHPRSDRRGRQGLRP